MRTNSSRCVRGYTLRFTCLSPWDSPVFYLSLVLGCIFGGFPDTSQVLKWVPILIEPQKNPSRNWGFIVTT